jgi:hypothetical protein
VIIGSTVYHVLKPLIRDRIKTELENQIKEKIIFAVDSFNENFKTGVRKMREFKESSIATGAQVKE